jgi:Arc/MetJ-type ribon-helix-helix transcriptional regulator
MQAVTRDACAPMPRPPSDAVQIALRLPKSFLAQADELAPLLSRPGFEASRSDALRAALARGLESLLNELASVPKPAALRTAEERSWHRKGPVAENLDRMNRPGRKKR